MPAYNIPFNQPALEGRELEYMRAAVEGGHTSASGRFSEQAREVLRGALDAEDVLLTTSCTDALELSAMLLRMGPGDRVIVPSFTFVSTALAFVRTGAEIVFADIEPNTLGIDPAHTHELLDERVKAVVPVHYAGVGCDMAGLATALEGRDHVSVVEDNAHGLFGSIADRPLGSFGRFSTLSFHETKNFVCGEGGALVVNQSSDVDRAHVLFDKGTNRRAFMLGNVDKYSWKDTGSSFGLSDILAAYLLAQLEEKDTVLRKRREIFERYDDVLRPRASEGGYRTPSIPDDRTCAYHMYYLLLPDRKTRDRVLTHLRGQGVHATFHYVPLHDSDGGKRYRAYPTECPTTEDVSGRLLRLPFFNALKDDEIDHVVESVFDALRL